MSSSKTPPSDLPPPAYDSLYDPPPQDTKQQPPPLLDPKSPPLPTTLANLRILLDTAPAPRHGALLTHMAATTSTFLTTYSTLHPRPPRARLSFVSAAAGGAGGSEAIAAPQEEYAAAEALAAEDAGFWADEGQARELAAALRAGLEERVGGLEEARRGGVGVGVGAEMQTWRWENVFGVWESGTGWAVVVRVEVDVPVMGGRRVDAPVVGGGRVDAPVGGRWRR